MSGLGEHVKGRANGSQGQDRRVGKLPAFGPGDGFEMRRHLETGCLVVSPPATEAGQVRVVTVTCVNEAARHGARPGIQVLVSAPDGEIRAPLVHAERDIAGGMGEIEADGAPLFVTKPGDLGHVEDLAGVVLHARQHDEGDGLAFPLEDVANVFFADQLFTVTGCEQEHRACRIVAMEFDLGFHGVVIGREGVVLDQDPVALAGRPIKAHHHQMQVGGKRIHGDDFRLLATHQFGHGPGEEFMVGHPRECALEMALDPQAPPAVQFGGDMVRGGFGLKPERVAAEIDLVLAAGRLRDMEPVPEVSERILPVHSPGEVQTLLIRGCFGRHVHVRE